MVLSFLAGKGMVLLYCTLPNQNYNMMRTLILLVMLAAAGPVHGFDRNKPAYLLYNDSGREVNYRKMMRALSTADIVLFGELHDNPISHWLQLEVTHDLFRYNEGRIVMGAEMFESDNQLILDEYLGGLISESRFEAEAKLWSNYKTDYKPLVLFAMENSIRFVASNIPRRYANMVFIGGFEALGKLGPEALKYIVPLPAAYDPELPGYRAMLDMGGGAMGHSGANLPKAQAIKDATMAHFILDNMRPGHLFIHYHGAYHSDNYEGIYWYLKQSDPGLKIVTITTVLNQDPSSPGDDFAGRADFIIVVPEKMTRTY
jgi:uncharacterized iron-regulated protein